MTDLRQIPLARELFTQWTRARGSRVGTATRPFSRDWEKLLADAGLHSGLEIEEAGRDAQSLAGDGRIVITFARHHASRISRIVIPLAQESLWMDAFGFVPQSNADRERMLTWPWEAELRFCVDARLVLSFDELEKIDRFLKHGGRNRLIVPIKERSLEIFGDEKRLDELYRGSVLFDPARLTLAALRCFVVPEPLAWARGPKPDNPLIVLENVATWDSYRRWNSKTQEFGAVVYGGGDRFREGVLYLATVFTELGGPRPVYYFGDLDAAGLRIPRCASERATAAGMPAVQPHHWSYHQLIARCITAAREEIHAEGLPDSDCRWLGELGPQARSVIQSGSRMAQEHIGWEFLSGVET